MTWFSSGSPTRLQSNVLHHLKALLGLEDCLPRWLTLIAGKSCWLLAGDLSCPKSCMCVFMTWPLASPQVKNPGTRGNWMGFCGLAGIPHCHHATGPQSVWGVGLRWGGTQRHGYQYLWGLGRVLEVACHLCILTLHQTWQGRRPILIIACVLDRREQNSKHTDPHGVSILMALGGYKSEEG